MRIDKSLSLFLSIVFFLAQINIAHSAECLEIDYDFFGWNTHKVRLAGKKIDLGFWGDGLYEKVRHVEAAALEAKRLESNRNWGYGLYFGGLTVMVAPLFFMNSIDDPNTKKKAVFALMASGLMISLAGGIWAKRGEVNLFRSVRRYNEATPGCIPSGNTPVEASDVSGEGAVASGENDKINESDENNKNNKNNENNEKEKNVESSTSSSVH